MKNSIKEYNYVTKQRLTSFLLSRYGCEVEIGSLDGGGGSFALASTS